MSSVEALYRPEHAENPVILTSPDDVDKLLAALLANADGNDVAQLICLERPVDPVYGFPDHELCVVVDNHRNLGAMRWRDADGLRYSSGPENASGKGIYSLMGHLMEFPDHSDVPIDLVRQAAQEFLLSGGKRPACVEWQEDREC